MKKIACIILATALFAMPVYAADIDRTSMSDEELLDIQTRADEETSNSSLEVSAVLSGGKYVGGEDIKTGRYVFTPAQTSARVFLYDNMDDCENGENELESGWVNEHVNMSFNISDGQVLMIMEDVVATLAPVLPFAPSETDTTTTEAVSAVLSGGKYVGGEDIKTGRYVFTPVQTGESSLIYLYDNMDDCANDENELESGWVSKHENMSFYISDGQVLVIREDVVATLAPALPFAPSETDTTTTEAVSAVLSGGKYVGGEDIKTGWYVLTPAKTEDSALVYLYDNMEDCENEENKLESGWVDEHSNMSFNITDGQVLVIREDVVVTFDPTLPHDQSETDTTSDTTSTETPSIVDPDQIVSEITSHVWETTEDDITFIMEFYEGGAGVAKETDGSDTAEYPAKWSIKDGKVLFSVDTNILIIELHDEGGTPSLLLYDDSDQLRGVFTPVE